MISQKGDLCFHACLYDKGSLFNWQLFTHEQWKCMQLSLPPRAVAYRLLSQKAMAELRCHCPEEKASSPAKDSLVHFSPVLSGIISLSSLPGTHVFS